MRYFVNARKLSTLLLILCGLILFLWKQIAQAETQLIGQVVWTKGFVQAISAGQTHILGRRSPIYEQDTIVTGANGSGEIVFTDNSIVALRPNTSLKIEEYRYSPHNPPKDNKYVATVAKGGFRTITGLISKKDPDRYQVNTPVATIGVRGTEYMAFYSPVSGLAVSLIRGKLIITNPAGQIEMDARNRPYSQISGLNIPPATTNRPSSVFGAQPSIISAPAPSDLSAGTGNVQHVSGFCIN